MEYLPINDISDIQPEKISIRQLNQKYIDRYGNRFATKFNLKTKKVEIVRLAASKEEALRMREEIRKNIVTGRNEKTKPGTPGKQAEFSIPDYYKSDDFFEDTDFIYGKSPAGNTASSSSRAANNIHDFSDDDADYDPYSLDVDRGSAGKFTKRGLSGIIFYEKPFIDRCLQEIQKTKERQTAIISHVKKTKIFERNDKDRFDELEREIDIECWQRGEKTVNYHRELYSYPRPLNYYTSRIPSGKKALLESKENEEEKLELIRRWELQENFENTYKKFHSVTEKVKKLLSERIENSDFKTLSSTIQQLIKDSNTSCEIILQTSVDIIQQIQVWRNKFP